MNVMIRGVTYEIIADAQSTIYLIEIANPDVNMDEVKMHKAPKIAVYSPPRTNCLGMMPLH